MLNFVKTAFRGFFEVILWINLILCAIGGGVFANITYSTSKYYGSSGIHPVLGVLIGLVLGIITNIVGGGFIATILNMDENLEKLNLQCYNNKNSSTEKIHNEKKCEKCGKLFSIGRTSCPHCGNSEFK